MNVVVVGGGPAGMIAGITSAEEGNNVILVEKNSSLGNKLKITGKGRCNITFDGDEEKFRNNIVNSSKFMYSSFSNFNNKDVVDFFNKLGVKTKVERGGRVFPVSDSAMDVVNALKNKLKKENVKIKYNSRVVEIITENEKISGVKLENGTEVACDKCIIATGGKSYSSTGSTGDGYILLEKLGHSIKEIKPGLVPLKSEDKICKELQGLSLRNVKVSIIDKTNNKILYSEFGEMMFSHFGVTGPVVLSASSKLNTVKNIKEKIKNKQIELVIDLKPALSFEVLDKRIQRDFEKYTNKEFKNSLNDLLPQKLISPIINLSKIDKEKKVHQITREQRENLVNIVKNLKINISGFMPLDMAIVTSGGINTKEINPKTMESKIVKGLYVVGELLDVDAYTGGYNLQIAFSTGVAAGKNS